MLATWGYVLMACNVGNRMLLREASAQLRQCGVLRRFKRLALQPFQFNANGKIVAIGAGLKLRLPRMPGTPMGADELPQLAGAGDEKVRADLQAANAGEVRVRIPIELTRKQLLNETAAVLTGRKTDGMQHDQVYCHAFGAGTVVVRR